MPSRLVDSLEPYKDKVIPFLSARRSMGISPNTDLDRCLAVVIENSPDPGGEVRRLLSMGKKERESSLVRDSFSRVISSLRGSERRIAAARESFEADLREGRLSRIPDHLLPPWYHAAKPPFSAYATFVEKHSGEIIS